MDILVPISFGELVDKITILEIKMERATNQWKFDCAKKEHTKLTEIYFHVLNDLNENRDVIIRQAVELKNTNNILWDVEDNLRIKEKESDFGEEFVKLARSVYELNDHRFSIKDKLNQISNSEIREVKEFTNGCQTE